MIVDSINIKGARQNNLKNIDVIIPRNKLVIITGIFYNENIYLLRFLKIILDLIPNLKF